MKISTILDHIDSGHMALPEFQRGYVWNRDQIRGLFDSMYRRHPVGGLLVWATEAKTAAHSDCRLTRSRSAEKRLRRRIRIIKEACRHRLRNPELNSAASAITAARR